MPTRSNETHKGSILVVDDDPVEQKLLRRSLDQEGLAVETAANGQLALQRLQEQSFDAILLDLLMPEMDGYEVLRCLKADPHLRHIPVIVISSLDEMDSILSCIEMGAIDFIPKPFNPLLLHARLNASLAEKRLHDLEQNLLKRLQAEQEKSDQLLLNIVPAPVADRLKRGEKLIVEYFPSVSVLFADIVGFTRLSTILTPVQLIRVLNSVFSAFDDLVDEFGLEKIKTSGDAYIAAGSIPLDRPDHAEAVAGLALAMQATIQRLSQSNQEPLQVRIGVNSGPAIAGVIGVKKFVYDLWGDTINVASRLEACCNPEEVLVSEATYSMLQNKFRFGKRDPVDVKGKGQLYAYRLIEAVK